MKKQDELQQDQPFMKPPSSPETAFPEALDHTADAVKAIRKQYESMLQDNIAGIENVRVAKYELEFSFINQVCAFSCICACDDAELYERYGLLDLMS